MKCPRCKHDMKREKVDNHKYRYKCPYCGLKVGNKEEKDTYKEAYEIVTGIADHE